MSQANIKEIIKQEYIKAENTEKAVETLDTCLLIIARAQENGATELDGKDIDLWKMRVWVKIEDLGVLPEANLGYETQDI